MALLLLADASYFEQRGAGAERPERPEPGTPSSSRADQSSLSYRLILVVFYLLFTLNEVSVFAPYCRGCFRLSKERKVKCGTLYDRLRQICVND